MRRARPLRIAIDTGGTFTDCVWSENGRLRMLKVFSTRDDPSRAIVEALRKIVPAGDWVLLHGTTVGTNTLLERKGARTALVTTAGFEDAIEIGRQARPKLYDFFFDPVEPLVPRDLRFGVNERTAAEGEILSSPTAEELKSLAAQVAAKNPESIAISLLFSFANPRNEEDIADTLRSLAVPLSISHRILPEFREYERTSTVVINAYLQPVMRNYLDNLQRGVTSPHRLKPQVNSTAYGTAEAVPFPKRSASGSRFPQIHTPKAGRLEPGAGGRIFVMQSSGGITTLTTASHEPVRTVLSGPAGGVIGAAAAARASGFDHIIAFDMGGTSTDVSLVEGEIKTATDAQIAGFPVAVPMLDIHTVGAGGGSLARFDAAGVLRVGPESAGADPGPICYGRGVQPTVTDANLLLGRLQPARFLGGGFQLDLERTRRITGEWLTKQGSNLSLEGFALGIIRVVNATMEKAIRVVSIERGRDPRQFALVAFGGAGGLHACELAEALSIPTVIIPALPGALSALGILASDVVKDYSRTVLWRVAGKMPHTQLNAAFSALKKMAAQDFEREAWRGKVIYRRSTDLRYRGQGYELNLPLMGNLLRNFQQEHRRRYGYAHANREIEIVTLRLRAFIRTQQVAFAAHDEGRDALIRPHGAKLGRVSPLKTAVAFDEKKVETNIYSRDELRPGRNYSGPAIITEYSATTVIPSGKRFRLDRARNLIVNLR